LLLDAGALIAVERRARWLMALIEHERREGKPPITHAGVIGQVWRGGQGRQAPLAMLIPGLDVRPLDLALALRAGLLLGRARSHDIVDAGLVLLADDGDRIVTSDPNDIARLARAAGRALDIVSA
jgi:hypothetical protein